MNPYIDTTTTFTVIFRMADGSEMDATVTGYKQVDNAVDTGIRAGAVDFRIVPVI